MAIIATAKNRSPKEIVPAGTHVATVYSLIDLGTQHDEWQGQPLIRRKIRLGFELPSEMRTFKEGEPQKPMVISQEFTLSLSEKSKLLPVVEGIVGKLSAEEIEHFELNLLIGRACLVTVTHGEGKNGAFAKLASTAPLLKGMEAPQKYNTPQVFDLSDFNKDVFDKLPDFLKEKIVESDEYKAMGSANDIPFE